MHSKAFVFYAVSAAFFLCDIGRADIILGYDFESEMNLDNSSGVNGVFITNMNYEGEPKGAVEGPGLLSRRSEEVALSGSKSFRFGLNYEFDYRPWNGGFDVLDQGVQKPRSAITWNYHVNNEDTARLKINKEYWFGIAYYFPEDYIFDFRRNRENIFQMHKIDGRHYGTPDRYTPAIVDFTLWDVDRNDLCDDFEITLNDYYGNSGSADYVAYSFKVVRGQWHHVVLHFKFTQKDSPNEDEGFFNVYVDGSEEPVLSVTGANAHPTSTEYRITPNFYKYNWHSRPTEPSYTGSESDARADWDFVQTHPNITYDDSSFLHSDGTYDRFFYIDDIFLGDEGSFLAEVAPNWPGLAQGSGDSGLAIEPLSLDAFLLTWNGSSEESKLEYSENLQKWHPFTGTVEEVGERSQTSIEKDTINGGIFYRIAP